MPANEKKHAHTLEKCKGCQLEDADLQTMFPGAKSESLLDQVHASANLASDAVASNSRVARSTTRKALAVLNETSRIFLKLLLSTVQKKG